MIKITYDLAGQHQDVDIALSGGSSEDKEGPFTVQKDCL